MPQRPLSHLGLQEPRSNKLTNFYLPESPWRTQTDALNAMAGAQKVLKSFSSKSYQSKKFCGGI
jgi:hypothetical protein